MYMYIYVYLCNQPGHLCPLIYYGQICGSRFSFFLLNIHCKDQENACNSVGRVFTKRTRPGLVERWVEVACVTAEKEYNRI